MHMHEFMHMHELSLTHVEGFICYYRWDAAPALEGVREYHGQQSATYTWDAKGFHVPFVRTNHK